MKMDRTPPFCQRSSRSRLRRLGGCSRTLSSGGRVLCVTALGKGLAEAQKRAYEAVAKIDMEKSQHRSDIGAKGLRRL